MNEETIKALQSIDAFHKKCLLLFEDIVTSIREKTLPSNMTDLVNEGNYSIWDSNQSEHMKRYVFEQDGVIRFVYMLIKTKEEQVRAANGYKTICQELGANVLFPLILVWGIFKPRDVERFRNQLNVRRSWTMNTVLLQVPDNVKFTRTTPYTFKNTLTFNTPEGTDSYYCENASFIIYPLTEIQDSHDVERLVDELLESNES